jgi:Fic family protein/DNA-binding XRE family transcriptional regulator|uniref:Fic family protein n=1 Tax=Fluviicola sp. TaxID=1917219 RepID=UPI00404A81F1
MKELLQQARKAKKMRSRELAQLVGIDQSLISKFENGKRTPTEDQLMKISVALEIPFESIMKAFLKTKIVGELSNYSFAQEVLSLVSDELASYYPERSFQDPSIEKTLEEIVQLKKKLDLIRSFENHRITDALAIEYTFESNKIEGNTLTLRETEMVINKGLTVSGKSMREHLEAINHSEAIAYIRQLVADKSFFTERELLSIHNLILRGIHPEDAGKYRSVQVMIQGSSHLPPSPFEIKRSMDDYFYWYQRNHKVVHPIVLAAEMHERLVTIHPFIDGNGRTARLVMNMILLQHGFVIANIKGDSSSRMAYYDALESVQVHQSKDSFIKFVAEVEKQNLERYLSILS